MGGLSFWHILVIVIVVLVVFGHRRIPAAFGALGRVIGHYRQTTRSARKQQDDIIEGTFKRRDD